MRQAHGSASLSWIKDEIAAAFEKDMISEMRPTLITCERVSFLSPSSPDKNIFGNFQKNYN